MKKWTTLMWLMKSSSQRKVLLELKINSSTGVALHHDIQRQSGCFCPPSTYAKWARLIAPELSPSPKIPNTSFTM